MLCQMVLGSIGEKSLQKFAKNNWWVMAKIEFSALAIKNLQGGKTSLEYFEQGRESGSGAFGIRVSPKGKKTWFVMYKARDKKIRRFTLGTYPRLSLTEARKAARDTMTLINSGGDPQLDKTDYKKAPTMKDLWTAYQESLDKRIKKKAETSRKEEKRKWMKGIKPVIGNMKIQDIKRSHISFLLDKIADRAPVAANRTFTLLQVVFKTALDKGWLDVHPMYMMSRPGGSEVARKKTLTDEEIKALWPYFEKEKQGDIFKLGLLTAARSGEIKCMKWVDVDFENNLWTQENTKTGNDNIVPLSPQVVAILKSREQKSKYVFPTNYGSAEHTKCLKSTRKRIHRESKIAGWTNHDLRRTARTIMSRLNIKEHVRERVLNHAQDGITAVYDMYDYLPEKRKALNMLADEVCKIIGVEPAKGKVVKLEVGNVLK